MCPAPRFSTAFTGSVRNRTNPPNTETTVAELEKSIAQLNRRISAIERDHSYPLKVS